MTPEQCRAARAWLDWSQGELAKSANVSLSTVRDFEGKRRIPIQNNLSAMQRAMEEKGVGFTFREDGKPLGLIWTDSTGSDRE